MFPPLIFETLGPWSKGTKGFVRDIGQKLRTLSDDGRSMFYLKERPSLQYRGAMPQVYEAR